LDVLAGMPMEPGHHEEPVILGDAEALVTSRQGRDHQGIRAGIRTSLRLDRCRRREQDQCRGRVNPQRCPIAVGRPQDDPERPGPVGHRQADG
jgi:hypothetical protein